MAIKTPLISFLQLSQVKPNQKNFVFKLPNFLLPYKYGKRGVIPVARFIPEQIEVPQFQAIQQTEDYLASIPVLLGRGELDSQTALELSTLTKNWLDSIYARQEYDLKLQAQGGGSEQNIRIEGGLPPLPGTNVIMDDTALGMNGHNNGKVIDHVEPPAIDEPANSEASEP